MKPYGFLTQIHLEKSESVASVFVKESFENMTWTHPALEGK